MFLNFIIIAADCSSFAENAVALGYGFIMERNVQGKTCN